MKLVIVESPSKAKTINKYLGKDYKVIASYGHIKQLPSKKGSVDPEQDFKIIWEETLQAKKRLKDIRDNVKVADEIYLATDPDREGEAISWHLVMYMKEKRLIKKTTPIKRVVFNSITKENILQAFTNAREIDKHLVEAYLTRVSLDYLVGFGISPILWHKMPGSRSAGRVQSVALRIICEREDEIDVFEPIEYWAMSVLLDDKKKHELLAKLIQIDEKPIEKLSITNGTDAHKIKARIEKSEFKLQEIENKKLTRNPYAPFTTASLQQDAFNKLGFSARFTMQTAQKLYEGINIGTETLGLITYMRTDATQIDPSFITTMRSYINKELGEKYLATDIRVYKTKARNAQEAHEAIRPTNIHKTPEQIKKYLTPEQFKLYNLIWRRALASQMASAIYDASSFFINSIDNKITLKASGSVLVFDGFYKIYNPDIADKDKQILPNLSLNTLLYPKEVNTKQCFTEPPPRYSEATLVKRLEELGIGRPSTYANIISVLQERKYTRLENKRFIPEPRGRILNVFLLNYFSKYVDYNFTASLEESLDEVSDGNINWKTVLKEFWQPFSATLATTKDISIPDIMEVINKAALHHYIGDKTTCPKCQKGKLQIKNSKFGAFIGCSNYPDCTYTHQLETFDEEDDEADIINNSLLGKNDDGFEIHIKKGPYGFYVELNTEKPKRTTIPNGIDPKNLTLAQAKFLLAMPIDLGEGIIFSLGKFGPYLKQDNLFYSVKSDIFAMNLETAKAIIEEGKQKKLGKILGKHPKTNYDIILKHGRYGTYIVYNNKNIKIPKEFKKADLTLNDAIVIINQDQ
ncbi:DNA topoisomerase 1 [Candidatus Hepatincola sp. Av]